MTEIPVMTLIIDMPIAAAIATERLYFMTFPGMAPALTSSIWDIYTELAFDSGGVASGPMAAAFTLQFVMGASHALGGNILSDAFGVVALVAMMPLISIQTVGFVFERKSKSEKTAVEAYGEYDIVELWEESA